ncbi:YlbF family regulator [Desulfosporosinus sp. PR]|uniref:YlbF family regulator n=1 Tax=Candidatus Desulfosporosinus nitrosoreducens TaxID=3401928 RepID=UPI0027F78665|nr:YlbF family regulator [Desulfosporosinus sp. PR]MDQ7094971.1 YlbF family regulator [Desulfosporosinus sp. PR]
MDQIEQIMQKGIELGTLIAQTDIYKNFKKMEYELLHNPEARKLIEDLQKLKQEQYRKKLAGEELTSGEKETMQTMENECLKNSQVFRSNDANTKFQEFMEEISRKIKEGIKSVDTAL